MNTIKNVAVFLLVGVMLALQVLPTSAQGEKPPTDAPDQLTHSQMKNAIVVNNGRAENRSQATGKVYRLKNCNTSDPNGFCYLVISGEGSFANSADIPSVTALAATSSTISCGINIYNYVGAKTARLQQNVNATFYGTSGQTPVKLNWGDLRGTSTAGAYYYWRDLSGPTPSPSWGVYVARTGTAYSNASGLLDYAPPLPLIGSQTIVSTRLRIRSTGWSCS